MWTDVIIQCGDESSGALDYDSKVPKPVCDTESEVFLAVDMKSD